MPEALYDQGPRRAARHDGAAPLPPLAPGAAKDLVKSLGARGDWLPAEEVAPAEGLATSSAQKERHRLSQQI
jgi:hypothetical protein